ncbi:MAG: ribose 5-phosphate isomerase A, partial [Gammaproteobacteria bacterium]|nr:ribose 5-phosphate isomerase A [Gammaproteobacteria bacterium]
MDQDQKKQLVAEAAMEYVESGMVVGVGTGSTANKFIDLLGKRGDID